MKIGNEHEPAEGVDHGPGPFPPDFEPGLLTRVSVWPAHQRLHGILRTDLLRNGDIGETILCAHCERGWIVRQTQYGAYLRETRR
jgi:hypothetical protein